MVEFNLTGILDPILKGLADQANIPVGEFSSQVGGEGIGVALEGFTDFFTKGFLNKTIQGVAGLIAGGYAIWGQGVNPRLRRELLSLGTHELLRIVDPSPADIIAVRQSLVDFIAFASKGDWNTALGTVLTTPAELQALMGLIPGGQPAPAPAPGTPSPAKTPATPSQRQASTFKGKYRVTD